MTKEFRIVKTSSKTAYSLGGYSEKINPSQLLIKIPLEKAFVTVRDGFIDNIPYSYKGDGSPVPAEELMSILIKDNRQTLSINAKGPQSRQQYGTRWFIDYSEELDSWFKENNVAIPDDKRSIYQKAKEMAMYGLQMRGLTDEPVKSPGQAALEAAHEEKAKKEVDDLKAQLEAALAKNKELEAAAKESPKTVKDSKIKDKEVAKV
jgi:hypothetical protein